ncbi:flippase activity-associated protein Agl23 [Halorubellus sp. JP-L1]|uniref:flippase activity-associated protein Agl23 n=1 Tax=Halorubellus sp. JP-L1 TaxID=2715753 RepID=UPI001878D6E6|nr:flippase activity-associated protein Agl23 [Halorubellus sp. JP-L1]
MTDESSEPSDEDPPDDGGDSADDDRLPGDVWPDETPAADDSPTADDGSTPTDDGSTPADDGDADGGFEFGPDTSKAGHEKSAGADASSDADATGRPDAGAGANATDGTPAVEDRTEDADPAEDADDAESGVGEQADRDDRDGRDGWLLSAANRASPFPDTSRSALYSLIAMTIAGLALRFVTLGARVAHQDEGRVGYWIIRYLESGVWEYRAIVHGPFLFHVNKYVFEFLGPSDVTARLVVAVIGGLLPLTAWLFREHLRDTEIVALGLLLALNPVLVYYSRFMRNDVPLAAFMLLAVGAAVRYYDTGKHRYVFAAVGAFALGMTTKENGLLYAACWLGAAVLLLDHRLFVANHGDGRGPFRTAVAYVGWLLPVRVRRIPTALRGVWSDDASRPDGGDRDHEPNREPDREPDHDRAATGRLWFAVDWRSVLVSVGAVLEFFAIIVFFYAPRGGGYLKPGGGGPPSRGEETTDAMGLYSSLGDLGQGDPTQFLAVVEEATVGSWEEFTRIWGGHEHSYTAFLQHYVEVMIAGALVVSAFAVVGFLVDRYGDGGPRDLVALASYWGFVSVLGYPIATDIQAGWATAHAIVPLAIPAAVGLAILFRWGIDSYTLDDGVGVAIAAVLLLCVFGWMGFAVADQVYVNPQDPDNTIIQYAQPSTDAKPTLERVRQLGLERGGPGDVDALFWGDGFAIGNESQLAQPPAPNPYYDRRTWMWYMEMYQYDANQSGQHFVYSDTDDASVLNDTKPPVVVTLGQNEGPRYPEDGGQRLHEWLVANGYERVSHQRYGDSPDEEYSRPILFYLRVDPDESTSSGPRDRPPIGTADATNASSNSTPTSVPVSNPTPASVYAPNAPSASAQVSNLAPASGHVSNALAGTVRRS